MTSHQNQDKLPHVLKGSVLNVYKVYWGSHVGLSTGDTISLQI